MDPRIVSGLMWILLALFMIGEGIWEYVKSDNASALIYVGLGAFILLWQFLLYRRTGKIGGPL